MIMNIMKNIQKKYPDVKPQLNIISAQQAQIPPITDFYTNPGEQVQRLIQEGKLKKSSWLYKLSI